MHNSTNLVTHTIFHDEYMECDITEEKKMKPETVEQMTKHLNNRFFRFVLFILNFGEEKSSSQ